MSRVSTGKRTPVLVVICAPVLRPAGAAPPSHLPIDGWREWRHVRNALAEAEDPLTRRGAAVRLVRLHPPTLGRLQNALHMGHTRPAYPMIHLIGYTDGEEGPLCMEQENGREFTVEPEDLARIFDGAGVQIALLNICYGLRFAEALLRAGVRAVVTTRGEISDPEAALVAQQLYQHLAFDRTIGEAYSSAKASIVTAYAAHGLPPLRDHEEEPLKEYGEKRAENLCLLGDRNTKLPLPHPGEEADGPEFDLCEAHHNLPHPDTSFIGRGRELVQISDWMAAHAFRKIALTDLGGIGKSSLAVTAALRNSWRFRGIIHFTAKHASGRPAHPLDEIYDKMEAVLRLGGSLASIQAPDTKRQQAVDILNARSYLLILDNLEVLTDPEKAALGEFLQDLDPNSGTMALLTLRPRDFPPLVDQDRRDFHHLTIHSLVPADSIALLAEGLKLPAERDPSPEESDVWNKIPAAAIDPDDQDRIEALAERTDVPLCRVPALGELAEAAHHHPFLLHFACANLHQPENAWSTVLGRLKALKGQRLYEKVEDMIGQMCADLDLKDPTATILIQSLLNFAGGATAEALRFVWCGGPVDENGKQAAAFENTVDAVRRAALLDFRADRYDLRPLVRQYLDQHRRPVAEQRNRWSRLHATYFLALAEDAAPHLRGPEQAEWLERLEQEHDNLRTALESGETSGEAEAGLRLGGALCRFWEVRGHLTEGRARLKDLLKRTGVSEPTTVRGKALNGAGTLARAHGDYEAARALSKESLEVYRKLDDQGGIAAALNNLGSVAAAHGNREDAQARLEQSLAIYRELTDQWGIAASVNNLGRLAQAEGKYDEARAQYERSLAIYQKLGAKREIAVSHDNIGNVALESGEPKEAREHYKQSRQIYGELGDRRGIAGALNNLGSVAEDEEKYGEARALYEESLAIYRDHADRWNIAILLGNLGNVAREERNYREASARYRESLRIARKLKDQEGIVECLEGLAAVAGARARPMRAAKLFGATEYLREAIPAPHPPNKRAKYDRDVATARSGVDEMEFSAAWKVGREIGRKESNRIKEEA